ncbi:MAG: EndoU domain-containing protein [Micavibrio sp.]
MRRPRSRAKESLPRIAMIIAICALALILFGEQRTVPEDLFLFGAAATTPQVTERAEEHILYGDGRGGGHLHGMGMPCKSEFPAMWDAGKIIAAVQSIAANDNLRWERQDNGYYKVERMVEDVRVRVIVNRRNAEVVTAYPANTGRNPCPAQGTRTPANDNY